jgi:uncharacterized protein (TIGR03086 family)
VEALERATVRYAEALALVSATDWESPSTCSDWTVRDLADHVVGGNRFAAALLAGRSTKDAYASAFQGGFDDPHRQFDVSAAAQLNAFTACSLDELLPHPVGELSARSFLGFRVGDLLLHGWDLARSIGRDVELDDELVVEVWNSPQPFRGGAMAGHFGTGPSGTLPEDASLADRLLDATGRRRTQVEGEAV